VLRNGKPANIKNIDLTLPNSTDSSVDFLRKLFSTVFTQGAGLIVTEESTRNKRSGKMVNFYNMDVARITIEGGTNLIDNFIYESESGEPVIYKADKCIYINDSIDPSNLIYSLSRLQSLNDVVLMQAGIVNHMKNYFGGGAKDSIIVSTDAPISDKNMKVIKGAFDTFITSSATQSLFLNSKLNVERVSNSMSGSDMLNILKEINVMILEHFGVNAFLSSAFSAGGSGKSEEAKVASRLFFNIHLKPVFRNIELQFTRFFRNTLGITNAEVKFDFSDIDIIADSLLEKTDIATKLLKPGIISVNEARAMIDMPPIDAEAASKHWMPAYLLGNAPVSMEEYDAELERLLQIAGTDVTDPTTGDGTGTGSSGDEDNTNVVTDQTGRGNTAN
jgi:HK97 family phage portal protein